jgi:hypothetical protein
MNRVDCTAIDGLPDELAVSLDRRRAEGWEHVYVTSAAEARIHRVPDEERWRTLPLSVADIEAIKSLAILGTIRRVQDWRQNARDWVHKTLLRGPQPALAEYLRYALDVVDQEGKLAPASDPDG